MDVGYLVGDFDLLNVEHLDVLAQVRERCRSVVVGVLTDRDVVAATGRAPLIPEGERLVLVRGLRGVDEAHLHLQEGGGPDASCVTVFVTDGWTATTAGEVALRPRRQTASPLLRSALSTARAADAA